MRQAIKFVFITSALALAGCGGNMSAGCENDSECMRGQVCRSHACHYVTSEDNCTDDDGDGAGIGTGCTAVDCDDTNPAIPATSEICGNGVDDDCDSIQDEGCPCLQAGVPVAPGVTESCGMGLCAGSRECQADGSWGPCTPEHPPAPDEACNFQDDNCNGQTDEGCCEGGENVCPPPDGAAELIICSSNGVCR